MRPDQASQPDQLEPAVLPAHRRASDTAPLSRTGVPIPPERHPPADSADDDDLARYVELC